MLVREGFTSLEEIAYVAEDELLEVEEFDEELVSALQNRAKEILAEKTTVAEKSGAQNVTVNQDLLSLTGMTETLAQQLSKQGVSSREALAELSIDDLLDLVELSREQAGQFIMEARAHWFANEQDTTK